MPWRVRPDEPAKAAGAQAFQSSLKRLRRIVTPMKPKPASIIAQVDGSGTPPGGAARVEIAPTAHFDHGLARKAGQIVLKSQVRPEVGLGVGSWMSPTTFHRIAYRALPADL